MDLSLTPIEASMLRRILTSYLGDLRMEISDTDSLDFREKLKEEEAFVKRLLGEIGEVADPGE